MGATKDLAKEYAQERLSERKNGNEISFEDKAIFTAEDIENAFNAGRESVVENMPELEWKDNDVTIEGEFALCPVGRYEVLRWDDFFKIWRNPLFLGCRPSLSDAKQAANEDYKERIKQALGIRKAQKHTTKGLG